mgnify:FL=1
MEFNLGLAEGCLADALASPDTIVHHPTIVTCTTRATTYVVVLLFNPICYYLSCWDYGHSDALLTSAAMSAIAAEQARASRALQHHPQSIWLRDRGSLVESVTP